MVGMSKHRKPNSWPLLELAHIWIQLEAGIVISGRHGIIKTRETTQQLAVQKTAVLKTKINVLRMGLSKSLHWQNNNTIKYTLAVQTLWISSNMALHNIAAGLLMVIT